MKFLIDEDVPLKLLKTLTRLDHDAARAPTSTKDFDVARLAVSQKRTLIALDKDFTYRILYPPSTFNIIHIQIHPPFQEDLITAVRQLLAEVPETDIKGLIVLRRDGHLRIVE